MPKSSLGNVSNNVDTLKNITTYMHDYQQYIKSLKEQNICIIGYARKSNGSEKEVRVCLAAIDHASLSTNPEDLRDFVRGSKGELGLIQFIPLCINSANPSLRKIIIGLTMMSKQSAIWQFMNEKTKVYLKDLFGNSAFAVVQNDMKNNVKKIRTRFLTDPLANNTLGNLMANESHLKKRTATEAVLWLKRGLDFTARSLKHSLDHPNEELTVSFSLAYNDTLRPYHSFIVRPIFNLAMNACPWRKDFYQSIGVQDTESITLMNGWLDALLYLISVLEGIFDKHPEYTKH
ncbi:GLTP-domain-containing protein [Backusella circina FSU 941]|nr:GLTP-domain-containing protein [Backusella circina FSU 941]